MTSSIDNELKTVAPHLCLGCVCACVKVQKNNHELWQVIDAHIQRLTSTMRLESLGSIPPIAAMRQVYKSLGKDPSRCRGSAEALLRRILSGKGMYKVNTVVDINNLVSLKSFHPVGSYDLERVQEPLTFRVGVAGESYKGIGKEIINRTQTIPTGWAGMNLWSTNDTKSRCQGEWHSCESACLESEALVPASL